MSLSVYLTSTLSHEMMNIEELARIIAQRFSFLQEKYGFAKLRTHNLGREVFFEFDRGTETVSISFERGAAPIIELFIPSSEENSTPWAEKDGIKRSRRFPKLEVNTVLDPKNDQEMTEYIGDMARKFESVEAYWLHHGTADSVRAII